MNLSGKQLSKNTMVSISLGTIFVIIGTIWMMLGIGRPLFASDLARIENKIDGYQTNTAVQILQIRKAALQSELREAKRDLRRNPDDEDAVEDVDKISGDIKDIETKITCHRTLDCKVESEI